MNQLNEKIISTEMSQAVRQNYDHHKPIPKLSWCYTITYSFPNIKQQALCAYNTE